MADSHSQERQESDLEKLVKQEVKVGLEWVDAKAEADQMKELAGNLLDALQNDLCAEAIEATGKKPGEDQLKRQARGSDTYKVHIVASIEAQRKANALHVRYKAYERLFEARRSLHVTRRKMEEHQGVV